MDAAGQRIYAGSTISRGQLSGTLRSAEPACREACLSASRDESRNINIGAVGRLIGFHIQGK